MSVLGLTAIPTGFPAGTCSVETEARLHDRRRSERRDRERRLDFGHARLCERQPARSVALHLRSSNTETVPSPALATYTVWVAGSIATAAASLPTLTVRGAAAQPAEL